jgi:hypothetical protein
MADQPAVNGAKEFFEKVLPEGFAAGDHAASGENASLHYVITGEGGGEWNVKVADGKMTVTAGAAPEPALVTFKLSSKDLLDAVNSRNGAVPGLVLPIQQPGKGGGSAAARSLKGTMVLHLTRPDGDPLEMEMCFNGAAAPKTEMTVALSDRIAMDEGRMNGQEAFMTGKIKVQGDMGFLMQVAMATGR